MVIKGVVNFAGVQSIFRNVCSTRSRAFFFQLDLFESCLASGSLVFPQRNIRIVKRVRVVVEVRCGVFKVNFIKFHPFEAQASGVAQENFATTQGEHGFLSFRRF